MNEELITLNQLISPLADWDSLVYLRQEALLHRGVLWRFQGNNFRQDLSRHFRVISREQDRLRSCVNKIALFIDDFVKVEGKELTNNFAGTVEEWLKQKTNSSPDFLTLKLIRPGPSRVKLEEEALIRQPVEYIYALEQNLRDLLVAKYRTHPQELKRIFQQLQFKDFLAVSEDTQKSEFFINSLSINQFPLLDVLHLEEVLNRLLTFVDARHLLEENQRVVQYRDELIKYLKT